MLRPSAAEAVHGVLQGLAAKVESCALQNRLVERGAAEGKVGEGDVEQPVVALSNFECLRRALGDGAAVFQQGRMLRDAGEIERASPGGAPGGDEEQVAISETR